MEAPHSSVRALSDAEADVNQILREIEFESEHFLAQNHRSIPNHHIATYPSTNGFPPTNFAAVASPPSVHSSVASPRSVLDGCSIILDANLQARPGTEMSNGWLPSPGSASTPYYLAQLIITEQPVERCRFRYRAEHSPHGALRGADKRQKSCPKVKVENFKGTGYVIVSLYTNEDTPRPHINELWGWTNNCTDGRCRADLDSNMCAMFPNLGIMRQKENDVCELLYRKYLKEHHEHGWSVTDDVKETLREKAQRETATMKDCLHCVRLGFQAFLYDESAGREFSTPIVLSSPIFNSQSTGFSELKIAEIDKSCGQAIGGDKIWLRCAAKIRRDQVKVVFHEPGTRWEAEGVFTSSDVHEQILIIFKTPAYHNINITERVHVNLHLLRTSDNTYSPAVDFVYLPLDDGPPAKRQRKLLPAFGPSGFGYFPDQSPATSGHSSAQHAQGPSIEFDAYMPSGGTGGMAHQAGRRSLHPAMTRHGRPAQSRDLDSGIGTESMSTSSQNDTMDPSSMMTSLTDVHSRIEQLSLAEMNRFGALGEAGKMQHYLTGLWETHVRALWNFSAEGDPEPFVAACKGLLALQDENGNTAIHTAVKNKQSFALKTMLKVVDTLPNKQQIIDERNFKKQTALHMAIRFGDDDCVHYLITAGADRTAIDADGQTVAHYLAETFNEDIYRDILFPPNDTTVQKIDLSILNNEGESAVHLAVKRKKLALLETLLEAQAPIDALERNSGKAALLLAVEAGDVEAVDMLLQNKATVNIQTYDGTTAIQLAAKIKSAPITAKLITAGADPNEKTSSMALNEKVNDEVEQEESEEEEEVLEGEGVELHSAFDFAGTDQTIIDILKGKPYNVSPPPIRPPPSPSSQGSISDTGASASASVATGGARPKTTQYLTSTSSKQAGASASRLSPSIDRSGDRDEASGGDTGITWTARRRLVASRSSSSSPEPLPAFIQDDLSSLDYVTRIRLSKLLDDSKRWEAVARSLGCEHMIELLKVCSEADNSSPTILLLDQLEHTPNSSVTSLLNALREGGHKQAVEMIIRKQKQLQEQRHEQNDDMQAGAL